MSFQAYLDTIEKRTGKTPQELVDEAHARGFGPDTKAGEIVAWLGDEYGLGRGHAMPRPRRQERARDQREARRHRRHPRPEHNPAAGRHRQPLIVAAVGVRLGVQRFCGPANVRRTTLALIRCLRSSPSRSAGQGMSECLLVRIHGPVQRRSAKHD